MRRTGLAGALLEGAIVFARKRGASIVEAYPVEPRNGAMPDAFVWTGLSSTFGKAGFVEVARRGPRRPIMRFFIHRE
jgi:hypothetical protein